MSMRGFTCPLTGGHVRHEVECVACPSPCMELPMLFTLGERRDQKPDTFYVTQMSSPAKSVALSIANDYYPTPQSLVWMNFGSAYHIIIERSREALAAVGRLDLDFRFEERFVQPLDVAGKRVELRGRADQYRVSTATLTDYKVMGSYAFKKLRDGDWSSGYDLQLNLYRKHLYPLAKRLQLACIIKDHSLRLEKSDGIQPFHYITVPFLEDADIDARISKKIMQIQHALAFPEEAEPCSDEERWYNKYTKLYTRCEYFCSAAPFCDQHSLTRRT